MPDISDIRDYRRRTPLASTQPPSVNGVLAAQAGASHLSARWRLIAVAATLCLIVVGVALRLVGLGHQSLWLDESFSVFLAAHRFPEILTFVTGSDAHPPLYYLILHVWMILGTSAASVRLLSSLASVATLAMVFLIGRRVGGSGVGLGATALMALSSFQIWYAQEARMYALVQLAVVVAMYALLRAWKQGRAGNWIVFTVAMLAAFYLDYSAFYVYIGTLAWYLYIGRRNAHVRAPFALSAVALVVGYLPWLPALFHQLFAIGGLTSWISGANGTGVVGVFTDLFFNRSNLLQPGDGLVAFLASAFSLALVGLAVWLPRHTPAYSLLIAWMGLPIALGLVAEFFNHPILLARAVMVIQPALFLLLALAVRSAWNWAARERRKSLMWARLAPLWLFLVIFAVSNISATATTWNTPVKEDWQSAASYIAAQQHPDDLILFNAYFSEMPFDYYFYQQSPDVLAVQEHGYQLDESLLYAHMNLTGSGMASGPSMSAYARVWLVLSHAVAPTDNAAVPAWLASHFKLVQERHFNGVTVRLYEPSV